ncbi:MAG TPA: hypothetical protein DDZ69_11655, partial [Porphyromonadaceae bacterium]|nr:hypothetical protein [Porphyromonadaceae bacterium]
MTHLIGYISQIIGPVVDVYFDLKKSKELQLPALQDALSVTRDNGQ